MSLSPFYSFQSQFVTYLLNRPHTYKSKLNRTAQNFSLHRRPFENLKSRIVYLPFHSKGKQATNLLYLR